MPPASPSSFDCPHTLFGVGGSSSSVGGGLPVEDEVGRVVHERRAGLAAARAERPHGKGVALERGEHVVFRAVHVVTPR
jgi:hypothetical protein